MSLESLAVDQSSAAEQVADALRALLLQGEIPPGAKLREVPLAKAIGVSRHTLRAGFRILEVEGLLEHALHRGVVVPELSADRIADVFRARKALEFAGIHAIGRTEAPADPVSGLEEAVARMRRSRSEAELVSADLDYHSAVVAAVDSRMIDELYRNIQAQLRLTRAWAQRLRGNRNLMVQTHGEVVDRLRRGEIESAAQALMTINDVGEQRLLEAMSELSESGPTILLWPPEPS